jgi:hypothetical protein
MNRFNVYENIIQILYNFNHRYHFLYEKSRVYSLQVLITFNENILLDSYKGISYRINCGLNRNGYDKNYF